MHRIKIAVHVFNILQKDWRSFLDTLAKSGAFSYRSEPERYSPWGATAGFGKARTDSSESIGKLLLIGTAVLIGLGVLYLWVL